MTEKAKFNLARLGMVTGSAAMTVFWGWVASKLLLVGPEVSLIMRCVRYLAGGIVVLFTVGWFIAIPLGLTISFADYNSDEDVDMDFDEYL